MANYIGVCRTNYFRVTDEKRYEELFNRLCAEDTIHDFTKEKDGVLYHGFGCYDSIDYLDEETKEYYFDVFLEELQKILPDDEAFILMESGHEKLRYVTGYVVVCTSKEIKSMSSSTWAIIEARKMLGKDFDTELDY